ncbi:MAG: hypothetical protein LC624_02525, partial [Halobacteriales archaeon]|nr:hypothetical protein [Halobacteriales archaeon]
LVLHAFVFSVATQAPVHIRDPDIVLQGRSSLAYGPDPDQAPDQVCTEETIPYGGVPDQCVIFRIPDAWALLGNEAFTIQLRFTDAAGQRRAENYDLPAHGELHLALQGMPGALTLAQNDQLLTAPTPIVVVPAQLPA